MANVNDFVGRLAGGGARSNQFQVVVSPPAVNPAGIPAPGLTFMFLCRSAQIPASTIGEVLVPFRGRQIFLAGDRTYDASKDPTAGQPGVARKHSNGSESTREGNSMTGGAFNTTVEV